MGARKAMSNILSAIFTSGAVKNKEYVVAAAEEVRTARIEMQKAGTRLQETISDLLAENDRVSKRRRNAKKPIR